MPDLYPLAWPLLRRLDPETAHRLALAALRWGLVPGAGGAVPGSEPGDPALACRVLGLDFANPVGLAAGFDKNAEAVDAVFGLGVGFVEIGGVTPRPQVGNPRPRVFRLIEDEAVINRLGLNSDGAEVVAGRLARRRRLGIVGVNLGRNKETDDVPGDYEALVRAFAPVADFLVLNVSSPNTPGLRALQGRDRLVELIGRAGHARDALALPAPPPMLLKIAPDLTAEDRADIARVVLRGGIDGLIVANTTIARPAGLRSRHKGEEGGLSGRPLFAPSTALLAEMYRLTGGRVPMIGVGGIASGADAYAKVRAGASLVELFSALVFQGPGLIGRIKRDLVGLARADGFARVADAVGADHPGIARGAA